MKNKKPQKSKTGNILNCKNHILVIIEDQFDKTNTELIKKLDHLKNNFCGIIYDTIDFQNNDRTTIYLTGNINLNYT